MASRTDPELERRARDYASRSVAAATADAAPTVNVGVMFTGDLDDLVARGFTPQSVKQHPSVPFTIAFGTVPLDRLTALGEVPHVEEIEGSQPLRPTLDTSVEAIHAKQLHRSVPPLTGAGVVIGVIDSYFDLAHPNFLKPDGSTRVLGYWDQGDGPKEPCKSGSKHPLGGWEYTQETIQKTLTDKQAPQDCLWVPLAHPTPPQFAALAHGTHVAGIAAGDGSAPDGCSDPGTYEGVAPDAELLLVRFGVDTFAIGDSKHLELALDWIWAHPKVAGRPVAVNISLGQSQGPHDGNTLVERAMDMDLLVDKRAIVVAAGNEQESARHAEGTVSAASADLELDMGEGNVDFRWVGLYYPGADALDAKLTAPGWTPRSTKLVKPNDSDTIAADWGVAEVMSQRTPGHPSGNRIAVTFDPKKKEPTDEQNQPVPSGIWTLALSSSGATPVQFNAWIDRNVERSLTFRSPHVSGRRTLTTPSTGRTTITVGAYGEPYLFGLLGNSVADFSSLGPTRDGRPPADQKPDLVAPGVSIVSARPQRVGGTPLCDCCVNFYRPDRGTSMAAPHVTGVVALMFQANPALSAVEIRSILRSTARRPDGFTGPLPDSDWGAGIVDAAAAVGKAKQPSPPPVGPVSIAPRASRPGGSSAAPAGGSWTGPWTLGPMPDLTPAGELVAALVSTHFSEVRGLLNRDLAVAAAWHRMQGPLLLQALVGLLTGTTRPPPAALDLDTVAARLPAFLAALERHGSPALRADLARHAPRLAGRDGDELSRLLVPSARWLQRAA